MSVPVVLVNEKQEATIGGRGVLWLTASDGTIATILRVGFVEVHRLEGQLRIRLARTSRGNTAQPPSSVDKTWLTERILTSYEGRPAVVLQTMIDSATSTLSTCIVGDEVDLQLYAGPTGALWVAAITPAPSARTSSVFDLVVGDCEVLVEDEPAISPDPPSSVLLSLDQGAYLQRWTRYNHAEASLEQDRADRLGTVAYDQVDDLGTGTLRFRLATPDEGSFATVERGMGLTATRAAAADDVQRQFTGEVESWRADVGTIDIRPINDDLAPPPVGILRYALAGSIAVQRRRLAATQQLATRTAPIRTLPAILELRSVPTPSPRRRYGWDSPAVRDVFGGGGPTDAQKRAIEIALNTPDVALIQGPPGTGKTKVIEAIAVRAAEVADPALGNRRVLLTSHGHDAVDNVASRTMAFGIPTLRDGGAARSNWVRRWRSERLRALNLLLGQVQESHALKLLSWVEEQREAYVLSPSRDQNVATMLEAIVDRCGSALVGPLATNVRCLSDRLQGSRRQDRRLKNTTRAIRALRCDEVSFSDDGAANCRALREVLPVSLDGAAAGLLDEAGHLEGRPPEDLLAQLAALQERLLDQYVVEPVRTLRNEVNAEVLRALNDVVDALRSRFQADGTGLAVVLQRLAHDLECDPDSVGSALDEYSAVVAATCQGAARMSVDDLARREVGVFDTVIIDEAARANPLDLQIPMVLARRRVILVGDQRQLPHFLDDRVAASVATSEEEAQLLSESLFGRLFAHLRGERRAGRSDRTITLDAQYRMHPQLGDFVSRAFYEPHGEVISSPRPASDFAHALPGYGETCAAWHDIVRRDEPARQERKSWLRRTEAVWVAKEVHRLMEAAPTLSFGVISFYTSQVEAILGELEHLGIAQRDPRSGQLGILADQWRFTDADDGQRIERLRVGTVDAFQGQEFDVVLLSAVRTPRGDESTAARAFGHLVVTNRLCVSMSRQRRLLIMCGDRAGLTGHPLAEQAVPALKHFSDLCHELRGAGHAG